MTTMKLDSGIPSDLTQIPARARALEEMGYDGLLTAETGHDPFLPLVLAAEHTQRIDLGTGIAVAFARNPMLLANLGHDLNAYSKGRFTLGLGSQIRAHITKRFSMPWSHPAPRMREMILAMRAIWDSWYEKKPLDFRGEFYQHTLMTPFFTPTNTEHGPPKVFLAAVGPLMTEVAGDDERRRGELEPLASPPRLLEAPLEGRQCRLAQVALGRERVAEHPVAHLAGRLGHQRADRGDHDPRLPMRVRPRVEERRHQIVCVEFALEVEFPVALPGIPDGADREHEFAHPRRRLRPGHRVAPRDVRLDLRAEPEREPAARERLDVVGLQRDRHRVASEGDDDRGADADAVCALGGDGAAEEGIDLRLERPPAVVAVALRRDRCVRRGVDGRRVLACIHLHRERHPTGAALRRVNRTILCWPGG